MSEWSKELAWKASVPARVPWVRIPLLPPKKGNNMFDALYKKMQKLENDINEVCEFEHIDPKIQNKLYEALSKLENLKGFINEVEDTILEEDSLTDTTNF